MKLDNVTICAIDCVHPNMAINSIVKSIKDIDFADCILFSHETIKHDKVRTVLIDKVSCMDDYDTFVFKKMHQHIQTDYVLIVQWDGWIIDSSMWKQEYLNYDYIGAAWSFYDDGYVVGNGGFSLRSKKLLQVLTNDEFKIVHNQAEDHAICREYRPQLEKEYQIKFAPLWLAQAFSYESEIPNQSTFGFHGVYNLWRHTSDDELIQMFDNLQRNYPERLNEKMFFSLLLSCFNLRKFTTVKQIYNIMKKSYDVNFIGDGIFGVTKNKEFTANFIQFYESI